MLARGEVEEIIIRPDVDIVTIILQDGAIVKNRRVRRLDIVLLDDYMRDLFVDHMIQMNFF